MCKKRSASCLGAFPLDRCLEMHLQNGSVLCICNSACNLSVVSSFGVVLGVPLMSGVTAPACGHRVRSSVMLHWAALLLEWNVGPSRLVADSIWTVTGLSCGSSTSLERQSAVLFWAPDIHSKVMLCVASSNPHLFSLLLAFFPLRNIVSGLLSLHMITSAPWRQ